MAKAPKAEAREFFLSAPTQGWDTETPVEELPQTRTGGPFDNFIPTGTSVSIRKGVSEHATPDIDDLLLETGDRLLAETSDRLLLESAAEVFPVETLMPYVSGVTAALFAAAGASIYNVTSAGGFGSASLASRTSARFSFVNFTTSGGSFLWICNGADAPQHWNGSAWAAPSLSLTTFNATDIKYVFAHKERLFVIFKDSLTFGYLATQAIAGTVSNFPLGAVFSMGGELVAGATLSRDGGSGTDDFAVFLTSEGEVAVYAGTNPGSAADWALVGVYYVGEPIGDRPFVDLGPDLGVITAQGLISVLAVMAGEELGDANVFARIATPLQTAITAGRGFSGWEGLLIPSEGLLLMNAPVTATTARQFIRHTASKGPGRFTGWNFETFEIFSGDCYAGTSDGRVMLCFDGYDDDGADITAAGATAWSMLGAPGVKVLSEIRPAVTVPTLAALRAVGRADFRDTPALGAWPMAATVNALVWNT
ncbi:MAG TPA: hypothetical protein VEC14_00900, partial [Reyranellaceae bacterium]|nr:hypothetical protein [Reyranellaceae bacterium]